MEANIKPKIAVALAVFNGIKWLPEQVESILQQKGVDVEIFISIDPSTDGSEALCKEIETKESCVHVLPNIGRFGEASKNFFRLVRDINIHDFDYFAFADQDDIWLDDKLLHAITCLGESNSQGYSSDVMAFWASGEKKLVKKSYPQQRWDYFFEGGAPGCTFLLDKKLACFLQASVVQNWHQVNLLGYHDWFTYALARANGFSWIIDTYPNMLYRQHDDNHTGVNQGLVALKSRWRKVINGWGIHQASLIAKVIGKVNDPFVKIWINMDRIGFLRLALRAYQCRRRPVDKIYFFISCIILAFTYKQKEYLI